MSQSVGNYRTLFLRQCNRLYQPSIIRAVQLIERTIPTKLLAITDFRGTEKGVILSYPRSVLNSYASAISRPGGNSTGVTSVNRDNMSVKWRRLVPGCKGRNYIHIN